MNNDFFNTLKKVLKNYPDIELLSENCSGVFIEDDNGVRREDPELFYESAKSKLFGELTSGLETL